jgi:hypothetical protein
MNFINLSNELSANRKVRTTPYSCLILEIFLLCWVAIAHSEEFRYRYVPLDQITLPGGAPFFPFAINNSGRVYGAACDDELCSNTRIAFYDNGVVTVAQMVVGSTGATVVNSKGTVGGFVLIDPLNFIAQAFLSSKDKEELIPPQPNEVFAFPITLNDKGIALVESFSDSSLPIHALYNKGLATALNFSPDVSNPRFINFANFGCGKFLNNEGVIAGTTTTGDFFNKVKGFRYDTKTGKTLLLNPLPSDTLAWGLGVNNRSEVLGYSFVNSIVDSIPYHENIGVWDREGHFKTYFTETISSNALLFNDNNLIVITLAPDDISYLIPKPGVRLNIADLVKNLPSGVKLRTIFDLNNRGDMLGFDGQDSAFLLKRLNDNEPSPALNDNAVADASPEGKNIQQANMTSPRHILHRHTSLLKSGAVLPKHSFEKETTK